MSYATSFLQKGWELRCPRFRTWTHFSVLLPTRCKTLLVNRRPFLLVHRTNLGKSFFTFLMTAKGSVTAGGGGANFALSKLSERSKITPTTRRTQMREITRRTMVENMSDSLWLSHKGFLKVQNRLNCRPIYYSISIFFVKHGLFFGSLRIVI